MSFHLAQPISARLGRASKAGRKPVNEDACASRMPEDSTRTTKGLAFVIADGVSSAEAAAQASRMSCDQFVKEFFSTPETWTVATTGQKVLATLNRYLYRRGAQYPEAGKGFVCTISALVLKSHTAHLFHVGDSRIYRLRNGTLEQLTRDHTVAMNDEETFLSRALGMDTQLKVDYSADDLHEGDRFLMTTDGVHDSLDPDVLEHLALQDHDDLDVVCEHIVNAAFDAGSTDNLTCQMVEVSSLPDATADEVNRELTRLPFPPDLEPGMVLDGFRIEEELHASSRSQLYRVTDEESGDVWVMKTPSVNFSDDVGYIERFTMESWIGSRINSPYVMKIPAPVRQRSCLYYIAEYVDGVTLGNWMESNPNPGVNRIMELVEQIVLGLRSLQRRETLHQDLKPDNIMIDREGKVRIVDFGSCYVSGIDEISGPIERDLILGTVDYAAPEYHLGVRADIRADLFSLGSIVYQMATGALPYGNRLGKARNENDFLHLVYIPAYKRNPDIPVWFDGALRRAVSVRAANRYPVLSEFVEDLRHPNQMFLKDTHRPLIERDPLRFWKSLSAILGAFCLILFYLLTQK